MCEIIFSVDVLDFPRKTHNADMEMVVRVGRRSAEETGNAIFSGNREVRFGIRQMTTPVEKAGESWFR